jgi:DNA invertase Pin-like site-specific DNA recombinase
MKEMRAAIYVRLSTSEQDTALQETELRQYVESRGWTCVVFEDKAQSGAKNDRPALNAMLGDMRRRKFDILVVWKLDRLARSLKQLLTIGEECRSLAVDLVSLRQNIDTTLPAGRLTLQILGAVAEFERELLRERVGRYNAALDGDNESTNGGGLNCSFSSSGCGVVFELSTAGQEKVLHSLRIKMDCCRWRQEI